ncbi:UPF0324 membrane protein [Siccirubricoccus deserti]|uniref:Sulfate exporter family transporter n=1 Tax=Siccirubricoccus deserti TaxID=2013562 RepID=A0A9X0R3N0_9PROT|nr:putative sulfate exporter family transporter [Siccirubricoccus deserti]MBC4019296.1 putative sulfate exporter family transporter [Siccirubricoccus deserti]GGC72981.1 UPF0324 membrane protein [Siccirubricoccus deserti]
MAAILRAAGELLPGLALCAAIAAVAWAVQALERSLFGFAWLDSLVLAILIGAAIRTNWEPAPAFRPGIRHASGTLLEVAVVLLGASLDPRAVAAGGLQLPVFIAGVVVLCLAAGYGAGRLLGLPHRTAMLIACGNAICGNSAIAAVAPVLGASAKEVASTVAFTAALGVLVVLVLPPLGTALALSASQYGTFAGLTVYAVPQVLAATAPFGSQAMQAGTLVKLLRVLTLGPVVLGLSAMQRRRKAADGHRPPVARRFVPWFILGFLALAAANAAGLVPQAARAPLHGLAGLLTSLAMAGLGVSVELRGLLRAGPRIVGAAAAGLVVLACASLVAIALLGVG